MPTFRKKPIDIEAVQWLGNNIEEIILLCKGHEIEQVFEDNSLAIPTKEGTMKADVGDWIIKGVEGEIYPCKPSIFDKSYIAV